MKVENLRSIKHEIQLWWRRMCSPAHVYEHVSSLLLECHFQFTFPQCHTDTLSVAHWLKKKPIPNTQQCVKYTTFYFSIIGSKLWVNFNISSLTCKKYKCCFFLVLFFYFFKRIRLKVNSANLPNDAGKTT